MEMEERARIGDGRVCQEQGLGIMAVWEWTMGHLGRRVARRAILASCRAENSEIDQRLQRRCTSDLVTSDLRHVIEMRLDKPCS